MIVHFISEHVVKQCNVAKWQAIPRAEIRFAIGIAVVIPAEIVKTQQAKRVNPSNLQIELNLQIIPWIETSKVTPITLNKTPWIAS